MLSSCTHKVTSPPCCCFRNSMNFMLIKADFEGISFLFYGPEIICNLLKTATSHWKFSLVQATALILAINIVVLGEFQNLIEIDANRNVLCDFNS